MAHTRALDRVLLWGHYVIPHWHIRSFRLVYWDMFGKPVTPPKYGISFPHTWWYDQSRHRLLLANQETSSDTSGDTQHQTRDNPADEDVVRDSSPDDLTQNERDTMIYIAFLGVLIVVVMLYLRRRNKRPT